jgi:histidinol-phosphate aminotransferase
VSALVRRAVREMAAYVPGEQPRDPSVVKLNTNENPYPPSPAVAEALRRVAAADLRLYPDPSCARLRERIAALHGCAPERVFVGNGSDEILALCTRAFGEPGGAIGWFDPSYSLYPVLARIVGAAARPVALGPAFGWANPGPDAGGLFFLATPNAPTGIRYARADVAAFCDAARGVVVLDEAYVDFASDHFADLALAGDRALSLRTLSKSWSLAGLRLGYALGPAELVAARE